MALKKLTAITFAETCTTGVRSLFKCIPESISARLREAIPDLAEKEILRASTYDPPKNVLRRTPGNKAKDIYEFSMSRN